MAGEGGCGDRCPTHEPRTDVGVAGFWRIAGAYSEASGFGAATVVLFAFTFSYWRRTNDRLALGLSVALVALLILSTSSTAYVAAGILWLLLLASIVGSILRDRLRKQDLAILAAGAVSLVAVVGVVLVNEHVLDPVFNLFDKMVFDKAGSASGAERQRRRFAVSRACRVSFVRVVIWPDEIHDFLFVHCEIQNIQKSFTLLGRRAGNWVPDGVRSSRTAYGQLWDP